MVRVPDGPSGATRVGGGRRVSRRGALRVGGAGLATALVGAGPAVAGLAQGATPESSSAEQFSPERRLAMTRIVLSALADASAPGAVVGIWGSDGERRTLTAGIGDLATAAPFRRDDHFRIASITKTFVATVVLQLVAEGKLSLDDHLEPFIGGIPNGAEITIRQLLNMTAGIYSYVNDPLIAVDYIRDPLLPFTPEQAVEIVRAHGKADFAPGARGQYSDTNYILLGLIIEQITRRSLAEEIGERIVVPLGLSETSFAATPDLPAPYAHGYAAGATGGPLRDVTRSNPEVAWGAGAMVSTLDDLRTWAEALVSGATLSPELQAERLTITPWVTEPYSAGYGLGILEIGGLLGHNGGILGYGSWMFVDPASGTTLVVVSNFGDTAGDVASGAIFAGIADLLFPGRGLAALVPAPAVSATPTAGA